MSILSITFIIIVFICLIYILIAILNNTLYDSWIYKFQVKCPYCAQERDLTWCDEDKCYNDMFICKITFNTDLNLDQISFYCSEHPTTEAKAFKFWKEKFFYFDMKKSLCKEFSTSVKCYGCNNEVVLNKYCRIIDTGFTESTLSKHKIHKYRMESQKHVGKANEILHQITTTCSIIDTNIWMNEKYWDFISTLYGYCRNNKNILTLLGPQFDEICNLKRNHIPGSPTHNAAMHALRCIELFQESGLLKIRPLDLEPDEYAYANPDIVKITLAALNKDAVVCFVTDDAELRIRLRGLSQKAKGVLHIFEGEELNESCKYLKNKKS